MKNPTNNFLQGTDETIDYKEGITTNDEELKTLQKELVIARLEQMPDNIRVSIG